MSDNNNNSNSNNNSNDNQKTIKWYIYIYIYIYTYIYTIIYIYIYICVIHLQKEKLKAWSKLSLFALYVNNYNLAPVLHSNVTHLRILIYVTFVDCWLLFLCWRLVILLSASLPDFHTLPAPRRTKILPLPWPPQTRQSRGVQLHSPAMVRAESWIHVGIRPPIRHNDNKWQQITTNIMFNTALLPMCFPEESSWCKFTLEYPSCFTNADHASPLPGSTETPFTGGRRAHAWAQLQRRVGEL
jgi:predicted permease